jgi:hypothetical protein
VARIPALFITCKVLYWDSCAGLVEYGLVQVDANTQETDKTETHLYGILVDN